MTCTTRKRKTEARQERRRQIRAVVRVGAATVEHVAASLIPFNIIGLTVHALRQGIVWAMTGRYTCLLCSRGERSVYDSNVMDGRRTCGS